MSAITSCAWSPDGTVIASGDSTAIVRIWDASTFRPLHVLDTTKTMTYKVSEKVQVTFTRDGRWLGSVSNTQYCIWDPRSGKLHKVIGPDSPQRYIRYDLMRSVPFDPEGLRIATISWSGMVKIYSIEDQLGGPQLILRPPGGTNEVAFSPDGRLLLAAMKDGTVRVWDTRTGAQVFRLKGHEREVHTACFSPCGRYIASASWDYTVRVWRTRDRACVSAFQPRNARVSHLAFSLDGNTFFFMRDGGTIWFDV
ncbi:hypothetical protein GSI_08188 [Ganoderma sinense ZZ0214-1]|uniref:Uncharacterized protein n=1 Tax=Ganoderma sinense ZZ0214-1 TaxID=1077348 RepID=A0A2G8S7J3_9APHY|nr:hypothetical protein GSI_08188 [Ganoderma sinense ZZ0214-1]